MSSDSIADTILALVKAHGIDAVTSAAVRTLPVITFTESNAGIEKYKDMLVEQKNKEAALDRLAINLEGEIARLVKQLDDAKKAIASQNLPAPEVHTEEEKEVFRYLFRLQASGRTNMMAAPRFLETEFQLDHSEAMRLTQEYMSNYSELKQLYGC